MSIPVFYHSGMAGFPAGNTRVAGGLISVLDACLVDGANLTTATGLAQTDGLATLTFSGSHNFGVGDRVLVAGATPPAYNGLQTVVAITANSASFVADIGTASPATGTITVKHPGAGWTKSWSGANMAAYRSATSDNGVGAYMQIEDNNPYNDAHESFRWRVCEGHTGLDTATRLVTGSRRFSKYDTQVKWWCVADDRKVYLALLSSDAGGYNAVFSFGELLRLSASDSGAWVFPAGDAIGGWSIQSRSLTVSTRSDRPSSEYAYQLLKTWNGLDLPANLSATQLGCVFESGWTQDLGIVQQSGSAPNPLTGAVELAPVRGIEQVNQGISRGCILTRGVFPGVYQPTGTLPASLFDSFQLGILPNAEIGGVPRRILVARLGTSYNAQVAFDLTGPWR